MCKYSVSGCPLGDDDSKPGLSSGADVNLGRKRSCILRFYVGAFAHENILAENSLLAY